MADFFKNNPIALRICILYVFLQEKSVEKAFNDFRKAVGRNVVKKEEFQFCFNKFEQGKFNDEKQPIPDIREIIRNDKQALRICVLYECLSVQPMESMIFSCFELGPLPVFARYKNFCKVIGDDVMDYREFDFWFYRFFNGEFDLNYERDKDKKIHELTNMPLDIIRKILEYCDIGDRLFLEKTSRSLRDFSRNQKLFHDKLSFEPSCGNIVKIIFGEKDKISYKEQGNDCSMKFKDRIAVLRDVSFRNQALQDFKGILENSKLYVNHLLIRVTNSNSLEKGIELKFPHLLHVTHLTVCANSMKTLLNILPSLEPRYLTKISLNILSPEGIEEVVETEQWKRAKYLNMLFNRFTAPLIHLYHFKEFKISYPELKVKDIREMREILFKSPDFEKCTIRLFTPLNIDTIGQEFGEPIQGWPNSYHYSIPNSTNYFQVKLEPDIVEISRKKN